MCIGMEMFYILTVVVEFKLTHVIKLDININRHKLLQVKLGASQENVCIVSTSIPCLQYFTIILQDVIIERKG